MPLHLVTEVPKTLTRQALSRERIEETKKTIRSVGVRDKGTRVLKGRRKPHLRHMRYEDR